MSKKFDEDALIGKEKINSLRSYKGDYSSVDLDHLIIYVMDKMEDKGIKLSSPNITVSVWKIFPDKFSIFGWPQYPDSSRISTGMWHLKDKSKRWVSGTDNHYLITERGRIEISKSMELLKQPKKRRHLSKTRKQEKLLKQVKKSDAYLKHTKGEEVTIFDLYNMLQCTLDSSHDVLKENYDALCVWALEWEDSQVIDFLKTIKDNFAEIKNA